MARLAALAVAASSVVWMGAAPVDAGDSAGAVAGGRRGSAASLSAGAGHTCALLNNNTISCWGDDAKGQVGNSNVPGEPETYQTPENTQLPVGRTAKAIATGGENSCVVLDDNRQSCWGRDDSGQIGDGPSPSNISAPTAVVATTETVVAVAVNVDYSCSLFTSGSVRCWGSDDDGQLGNGGADVGVDGADVDTASNARAVEFPSGLAASAVTTGKTHACAILDNAQISCWGSNGDGEIGNGTSGTPVTAPSAALTLPAGRTAESVSAGGNHTCAVLDNEGVTCWGSDASGQLGNGASSADVTQPPSPISLPGGAVAVATGRAHSCAVLVSNELYCWGDDSQGQIGTAGPNANSPTPVLIPIAPGVEAVALGDDHTCALLTNGGVTCWGSDTKGQLGNGAAEGSISAPSGVSIPGLTVAPNAGTPSAPREMTASGGRETATLGWVAPIDAGGSGQAISGYRIQESVDNGVTWVTRVENTGSTALNFVLSPATTSEVARYRVAAINSVGVSPFSQPSDAVVVTPLTDLKAFTPIRLLDSRLTGQTVDDLFENTGPNTAQNFLRVKIGGRGGAAGVPSNAPAAVLNVTAVQPDPGGFATVYPCGDRPNASTLNFPAKRNVANAVVAKLDAQGFVCVFTNVTSGLIIDATGYVPSGSKITTVAPARLLDTRSGGETIDGLRQREGAVGGGAFVEVQITGRAGSGVPAGADTALLNLTAANPSQRGFATVYPCGTRPNSSSLNFDARVNKASAVVAKLTAAGTVCIFVERTTEVILDVTGYAAGSTLGSVDPVRLLDTRPNGATIDGQSVAAGAVAGGTFVKVQIAGRRGVPAGARLAALSVVSANAQGGGFLTVYPCGDRPNASTLNYEAGQNVPNLALASLSASGEVCVFTSATTQILVDVTAAQ
jgi:alpha-tubulin suppressor-like RCC1 family protein